MYANHAEARTAGRRPTSPPAGAAKAALGAHLGELAEMLAANPAADRSALRTKIQEAQRSMRGVGADDGLLALLLRNMLIDLAKAPGRFEATYFAEQLTRVVDRLG